MSKSAAKKWRELVDWWRQSSPYQHHQLLVHFHQNHKDILNVEPGIRSKVWCLWSPIQVHSVCKIENCPLWCPDERQNCCILVALEQGTKRKGHEILGMKKEHYDGVLKDALQLLRRNALKQHLEECYTELKPQRCLNNPRLQDTQEKLGVDLTKILHELPRVFSNAESVSSALGVSKYSLSEILRQEFGWDVSRHLKSTKTMNRRKRHLWTQIAWRPRSMNNQFVNLSTQTGQSLNVSAIEELDNWIENLATSNGDDYEQ